MVVGQIDPVDGTGMVSCWKKLSRETKVLSFTFWFNALICK